MGSWSGWINTRDQLVNQFGGGNHPFYLSPQYQYRRDGNTVYYNVRLNLNYYVNSGWTNVNYNYGCGVKLQWGSASGTHDGSSDWVVTPGNNISQGWHYSHKDYGTYSITNTTGSGTVTIGAYANNQSTKGFDNPPRSGSSYGWHSFSLSIPAMETITITYNDNGGHGGPGTQTKTIGTDIALSSTKPVKDSVISSGYTITFNDTIGTPDYSSYTTSGMTTYTFDHWNTASDNSGTSYAPGATYTGNSAVTLYAIYTSSMSSNAGVPLPQSVSTTHLLQGWARGSASGTMVNNWYIPTQNETLYAVWQERIDKVKYKSSSNWLAGVAKTKHGSTWEPTWHLETNNEWQFASFYTEGTEHIMPVPCTWGYWLHSQYNTDGYYEDFINGAWRIVIEEDMSGSAFVLSELAFAKATDLWTTYITFEYDYNIQKVYYYTQLEYIESTGTQYINTGYNHNTSTTYYELDCVITRLPNTYHTFFGSRSAHNSTDAFYIGSGMHSTPYGHTYGCIGGTKLDPIGWTPVIGERYQIRLHPVTGLSINDVSNYPMASASNVTYNYPDVICALNQAGSIAEYMCMKVYSFKIYNNNVLVRDMVPCYRNSSIGMYDKVNRVFYDNAGTGTFIKGPEIDW